MGHSLRLLRPWSANVTFMSLPILQCFPSLWNSNGFSEERPMTQRVQGNILVLGSTRYEKASHLATRTCRTNPKVLKPLTEVEAQEIMHYQFSALHMYMVKREGS